MSTVIPAPAAIPPESGRELKSLGIKHKLTSAESGGAFYIGEAVFGPQGGSLRHRHRYEDEILHILQGQIEVRLDTETLRASAGGIIFLPKNVPHSFHNPLEEPLRIMVHTIPGGLERYFDEVDAALQDGSFNQEVHQQISLKYGLEWLE